MLPDRVSNQGPLTYESDAILFGKCTTLVVVKCCPVETRLPCGNKRKAEKLGVFGTDQ